MDAAKSNLAQAQKDADEQIKIVDEDSQMASDGNVKAAYDALKNVNNESHSISTTVTADSYDEAVASIEKAKTVDQKANDVKNAQESLKNAINAYHEAQAAQAAAASRAASSNSGSRSYNSGSTGGSQSRSYSGGGSGSTGGSSHTESGTGNPYEAEHARIDAELRKRALTKEQADSGHYTYCFITDYGYICS